VKDNCLQVFFVVAADGFITYVSNLDGGRMPDAEHFKEENMWERLEQFYRTEIDQEQARDPSERWSLAVGGDKAYPFIRVPEGMRLLVTSSAQETIDEAGENASESENIDRTPMRDPPGPSRPSSALPTRSRRVRHLGPAAELSPDLAPYRAVVERVIWRVKRHLLLSNGTLRESQEPDIQQLIVVLAGMHNRGLERACELARCMEESGGDVGGGGKKIDGRVRKSAFFNF
jgi:hypothetical protein